MFTQKSDVKNPAGVSYQGAVELRQSVPVETKVVPGCLGGIKSLFGMQYTESVLIDWFVHTLVLLPPPPHSLAVTSLLDLVACFTAISTFTDLDATVRVRWV